MKKGDLVRLVNNFQLPHFLNEDIGKVGLVTNDPKGGWTIVLVEGVFQVQPVKNLEPINAQD
jgi:hypothetical protein